MTETPESDVPDEPDTTDAADTDTPTTEPPTAQVPPPPPAPGPGMVWDKSRKAYVKAVEPDQEPHNREARYRQQLRSTESERDQLRERLALRDRADAERLAGTKLQDPRDLWAGGITLAEVVDESGEVDPRLVDEAVAKVLAEHPHWRLQLSHAAPASQVTSNDRIALDAEEHTTWHKLFTDARNGVRE